MIFIMFYSTPGKIGGQILQCLQFCNAATLLTLKFARDIVVYFLVSNI